jgi:hypothetical protein
LSLAALAGCAETGDPESSGSQATARPAPRCFHASNARNFRSVNSTTVHLRVGRRDFYRLDLLGPCPNLDFSLALGLQTRGSSQICTGSGLGTSIVTRSASGPQRCSVRQITALTPEEVAALSARDRP